MDDQQEGLLFCAKYAVSPNFFGYCGPDENLSLIDHLKENIADNELSHILSHFETLFPYLQLIARKNKIIQPFDEKVVEAYWIGNKLLQPVSPIEYQAFAQEKLFLDKKINNKDLVHLKLKISNFKFYPHHAFHVFNIFKRTGKTNSNQTIETMDNCRISYGRVMSYELGVKRIKVKTNQLVIINKQLQTRPAIKQVFTDYKGKSFINNLKVDDFVSFHWGMICDKLTEEQVKNLDFFTKKAIDFYNL